MKEPGLDGRHRDKNSPKAGAIQQKRGDTLNENLPRLIPQFSPNTTLAKMRKKTGKVSEEAVRRASAADLLNRGPRNVRSPRHDLCRRWCQGPA